jgi:hypothetical protein
VQSIFVTKNRLWKVETDDGVLLTTQTQPLVQCGPPLRGRTSDSSPPLRGRTSDAEGRDVPDSLSGRGATDQLFLVKAAGDLVPGDRILRLSAGQVREVAVRQVSATDRVEKVFNLVLGDSELFIAGGFVARSKPPAE